MWVYLWTNIKPGTEYPENSDIFPKLAFSEIPWLGCTFSTVSYQFHSFLFFFCITALLTLWAMLETVKCAQKWCKPRYFRSSALPFTTIVACKHLSLRTTASECSTFTDRMLAALDYLSKKMICRLMLTDFFFVCVMVIYSNRPLAFKDACSQSIHLHLTACKLNAAHNLV